MLARVTNEGDAPPWQLEVDKRPPAEVTRELHLTWREPRLGTSNPERLTNPVWTWLACNPEISAYQANRHFGGPGPCGGPAWTNQRFGQSRTELGDGRIVAIAGEHEDYYDPDFYIYNDVHVIAPDGALDIYCYPRELFAATDFHTASAVGRHTRWFWPTHARSPRSVTTTGSSSRAGDGSS
jgi:hypothetical protein